MSYAPGCKFERSVYIKIGSLSKESCLSKKIVVDRNNIVYLLPYNHNVSKSDFVNLIELLKPEKILGLSHKSENGDLFRVSRYVEEGNCLRPDYLIKPSISLASRTLSKEMLKSYKTNPAALPTDLKAIFSFSPRISNSYSDVASKQNIESPAYSLDGNQSVISSENGLSSSSGGDDCSNYGDDDSEAFVMVPEKLLCSSPKVRKLRKSNLQSSAKPFCNGLTIESQSGSQSRNKLTTTNYPQKNKLTSDMYSLSSKDACSRLINSKLNKVESCVKKIDAKDRESSFLLKNEINISELIAHAKSKFQQPVIQSNSYFSQKKGKKQFSTNRKHANLCVETPELQKSLSSTRKAFPFINAEENQLKVLRSLSHIQTKFLNGETCIDKKKDADCASESSLSNYSGKNDNLLNGSTLSVSEMVSEKTKLKIKQIFSTLSKNNFSKYPSNSSFNGLKEHLPSSELCTKPSRAQKVQRLSFEILHDENKDVAASAKTNSNVKSNKFEINNSKQISPNVLSNIPGPTDKNLAINGSPQLYSSDQSFNKNANVPEGTLLENGESSTSTRRSSDRIRKMEMESLSNNPAADPCSINHTLDQNAKDFEVSTNNVGHHRKGVKGAPSLTLLNGASQSSRKRKRSESVSCNGDVVEKLAKISKQSSSKDESLPINILETAKVKCLRSSESNRLSNISLSSANQIEPMNLEREGPLALEATKLHTVILLPTYNKNSVPGRELPISEGSSGTQTASSNNVFQCGRLVNGSVEYLKAPIFKTRKSGTPENKNLKESISNEFRSVLARKTEEKFRIDFTNFTVKAPEKSLKGSKIQKQTDTFAEKDRKKKINRELLALLNDGASNLCRVNKIREFTNQASRELRRKKLHLKEELSKNLNGSVGRTETKSGDYSMSSDSFDPSSADSKNLVPTKKCNVILPKLPNNRCVSDDTSIVAVTTRINDCELSTGNFLSSEKKNWEKSITKISSSICKEPQKLTSYDSAHLSPVSTSSSQKKVSISVPGRESSHLKERKKSAGKTGICKLIASSNKIDCKRKELNNLLIDGTSNLCAVNCAQLTAPSRISNSKESSSQNIVERPESSKFSDSFTDLSQKSKELPKTLDGPLNLCSDNFVPSIRSSNIQKSIRKKSAALTEIDKSLSCTNKKEQKIQELRNPLIGGTSKLSAQLSQCVREQKSRELTALLFDGIKNICTVNYVSLIATQLGLKSNETLGRKILGKIEATSDQEGQKSDNSFDGPSNISPLNGGSSTITEHSSQSLWETLRKSAALSETNKLSSLSVKRVVRKNKELENLLINGTENLCAVNCGTSITPYLGLNTKRPIRRKSNSSIDLNPSSHPVSFKFSIGKRGILNGGTSVLSRSGLDSKGSFKEKSNVSTDFSTLSHSVKKDNLSIDLNPSSHAVSFKFPMSKRELSNLIIDGTPNSSISVLSRSGLDSKGSFKEKSNVSTDLNKSSHSVKKPVRAGKLELDNLLIDGTANLCAVNCASSSLSLSKSSEAIRHSRRNNVSSFPSKSPSDHKQEKLNFPTTRRRLSDSRSSSMDEDSKHSRNEGIKMFPGRKSSSSSSEDYKMTLSKIDAVQLEKIKEENSDNLHSHQIDIKPNYCELNVSASKADIKSLPNKGSESSDFNFWDDLKGIDVSKLRPSKKRKENCVVPVKSVLMNSPSTPSAHNSPATPLWKRNLSPKEFLSNEIKDHLINKMRLNLSVKCNEDRHNKTVVNKLTKFPQKKSPQIFSKSCNMDPVHHFRKSVRTKLFCDLPLKASLHCKVTHKAEQLKSLQPNFISSFNPPCLVKPKGFKEQKAKRSSPFKTSKIREQKAKRSSPFKTCKLLVDCLKENTNHVCNLQSPPVDFCRRPNYFQLKDASKSSLALSRSQLDDIMKINVPKNVLLRPCGVVLEDVQVKINFLKMFGLQMTHLTKKKKESKNPKITNLSFYSFQKKLKRRIKS